MLLQGLNYADVDEMCHAYLIRYLKFISEAPTTFTTNPSFFPITWPLRDSLWVINRRRVPAVDFEVALVQGSSGAGNPEEWSIDMLTGLTKTFPEKVWMRRSWTQCTVQHRTSTGKGSTSHHSTAQHSTAQHSTAQHSTAQHSTAQQRIDRSRIPSRPSPLSGSYQK